MTTDPRIAARAAELMTRFPNAIVEEPTVSDYQKNLLRYAGYAALSVLVAVLTALAQQLPGNDPLNWRLVASAAVSALLGVVTMAATSSTLPRAGSEGLAADVQHWKVRGFHRDELTVIPKEDVKA